MLVTLLNLICILIIPFIMLGVIKKTKAFWAGRKGVSLWQPLFDFLRLLKKGLVISKTTSLVFKIAPVISLITVFFAGMFVPLLNGSMIVEIPAGFIIFAYTLGLGKFFNLLSAMDTGSSFEGMGASREACFTTIVEPAFFVILASIMLATQNCTFASLTKLLATTGSYGSLIVFFTVVAIFLMILIEGSRVPIDDPATHLELTMIHEVMILDNSGVDLAFLSWSNAIKMFLLSSIIANLIIPIELEIGFSALLYISLMMLISMIIGTIESAMARIRMSHVFEFVFIMNSLALVVLALAGFGG